jgi:5-methylcytosine-specific restriction endonuclease McrA
MTYEEQLNHPDWIRKRNEIMARDNDMCKKCKSKDRLQVHHQWYIKGRMAWDYPGSFLITLCDKCHRKAHNMPPEEPYVDPILKSARIIKSALEGIDGICNG